MVVKLACSTACFPDASIDVALEEIRRAGFLAIDLILLPGCGCQFDAARQPAVERQDFVALVRNSGLLVPTVTAAPGNFNAPTDSSEFIVQSALAHLKLAAQLGCEGLNIPCEGSVAAPGQFEAEAVVQANGLKRIAREAGHLGLNLNVLAPHRDGLCRNLEEARFLLEQINEDNVRLVLDVAPLQSAGVTPAEAVRALAGRIGHVRLRDCAGLDLSAFFEALERAGYDGYCALEPDLDAGLPGAQRRLRQSLRGIRACLTGSALVLSGHKRWSLRASADSGHQDAKPGRTRESPGRRSARR